MTTNLAKSNEVPANQSADLLIEETLQRVAAENSDSSRAAEQECCLVQIYPPDIVDGMLLLDDETVVIGRDPASDMCIEDSSVSRRHAEVRSIDESRYRIVDLNSTNGLLVNEKQVDAAILEAGDTIQIGCYLFKFLAAGSVESQYHETVYSALTTDALTGAMNKRYMLETLTREIARARRHATEVAVVMIDIDHFKGINDTYGHLVGDEVLREFSARLQNLCREDDLFARYGGEEFCLCVFDADTEEVVDITTRCLESINQKHFETTAGHLPITASFGVAFLSEHGTVDSTGLIGRADKMLYDAKHGGRNRVCR